MKRNKTYLITLLLFVSFFTVFSATQQGLGSISTKPTNQSTGNNPKLIAPQPGSEYQVGSTIDFKFLWKSNWENIVWIVFSDDNGQSWWTMGNYEETGPIQCNSGTCEVTLSWDCVSSLMIGDEDPVQKNLLNKDLYVSVAIYHEKSRKDEIGPFKIVDHAVPIVANVERIEVSPISVSSTDRAITIAALNENLQKIKLISADGRTLYCTQLNGNQTKILKDEIAAGTYFIKAGSGKSSHLERIFISR